MKVGVLPVPYEGTVTYGHGTINGPHEILKALDQVEPFNWEDKRSTSHEWDVVQHLPKEYASPEGWYNQLEPASIGLQIRAAVKLALNRDNDFFLMLGGEHSITYPAVLEFKERYPDLIVVQFDAHADLYPEFGGQKFSHASVIHHIIEADVPVIQVGVRTGSEQEHRKRQQLRKDKKLFVGHSPYGNCENRPVYITFDVDYLDPGFMPATGTPVPLGASIVEAREKLDLLRYYNVVGMDIVEYAPYPGSHHCAYLLADLICRFLTALESQD